MSAQYSSLSEQYYQLLESGDTEGAQAIEAKMSLIEKDMETQYEKATSSSDFMQSELNYQNAKNNKDSKGYDLFTAQHSLDLAKYGIFVSRS